MATNAFLKWSLGPQYETALLGITNMPKPETRLTLDFSSLLGEAPAMQLPDQLSSSPACSRRWCTV